jgi:hypothetical protein
MANVANSVKNYLGNYGAGADAYAGIVNSINSINGGVVQSTPPYVSSDTRDAAINLVKVGQ